MTFDTAPSGDIGSFALGSTYQENGIQAVSHSSYACFKDMLRDYYTGIGRTPTTPLYFHGTGAYIEFSLVGGGTFDLNSFEITSNNSYDAKMVVTSKSEGTGIPVYAPELLTTKTFSGTEVTGISWFRVDAGYGWATELDTITVTPTAVPEPSTLIAGALLCLPFGVTGMRSMRNRNKA